MIGKFKIVSQVIFLPDTDATNLAMAEVIGTDLKDHWHRQGIDRTMTVWNLETSLVAAPVAACAELIIVDFARRDLTSYLKAKPVRYRQIPVLLMFDSGRHAFAPDIAARLNTIGILNPAAVADGRLTAAVKLFYQYRHHSPDGAVVFDQTGFAQALAGLPADPGSTILYRALCGPVPPAKPCPTPYPDQALAVS